MGAHFLHDVLRPRIFALMWGELTRDQREQWLRKALKHLRVKWPEDLIKRIADKPPNETF